MNRAILAVSAVALLSTSLAAQSLPGILTTLTNPANGHTYHLLDQANWSDSEAAAVTLGGHLVTVDDLAENDFLIANFSNFAGVSRHLWNGLTDEAVEGLWVWIDGTPAVYSNWDAGEPNNSFANDPIHGEDYCAMYPGHGRWVDLNDASTLQWFTVLNGVVEIGSPNLAIAGLAGGSTATITVTNATAGGNVLLGYSLTGAGPVMTAFGLVDLSPPITTLPTLTANAAGVASMSTVVPGRASGFTLYMQGADLTSANLTNPFAEVIL